MNRLLSLSFVLAFAAGCGGGGLNPRDPVESCTELCHAACASFYGSGCRPDAADAEAEEATCAEGCVENVRCKKAVALGESFDECLDAVDSGVCRDPGGGQLPTVCQAVILIEA